jgi:flagellin
MGDFAVEIKGFGHEPVFRVQSIQLDSELGKRFGKLGLSKRIVTASDDPSGSDIMAKMEARAPGFGAGQRNASAGMGLTRAASGALDGVSDNLARMRELSSQAASGNLSDRDRANIDAEFQGLKEDVQSSFGANFGVVKIFDGSAVSFGVGPASSDIVDVQLPDSADLSGIDSLAVDTAGSANAAMDGIDHAMQAVATAQAEIGASESALSSASTAAAQSEVRTAASASSIDDAGVAKQSAESVRVGIMKHAVLSMQLHADLDEGLVGRLLT